ncbi:F-box protein At3g07870-like isoform X1 [Chenopodium quinoa]|uniref:F-box protein At3g07870-like isoform X1 n=2 Tax=Chenopodium quinoa TaxID=63459 RepID=UPI000B788F81|nr:F-box protein At3g07870-like isoform X1 [Chenopodium quinoa]XP_021774925.1 F-box protein At3g07870-like isoform X1 [Chenopodium quinoa]
MLIELIEELNSNRTTFEDIPSSIMCDILSRLPTKACLNCKLVRKDWYKIITGSEFACFRSSCSYFFVLLYGKLHNNRKDFLLLDLDKSSKVDEMGNLDISDDSLIRFKSIINIPHDELYVVNECNGVICLKSWGQWSPYIVCNLLTSEQVIVEQFREPSCSVEVYGLGCCPVSNQFKVVRILKTVESYRCIAEIQTLGTNKWRTVGDAPTFQLRKSGAFLHGSLHRYSYRDNCLWSFHVGTEKFSLVPVPDDMRRELYTEVSVFNSCLCFSSMSENCSQCEIWLMKEYGVKDSWVKQYVFQVDSHRMPLLQLDTGETLVSYRNGVRLGVCDGESGKCKRVQVLGLSSYKVLACANKFAKFEGAFYAAQGLPS